MFTKIKLWFARRELLFAVQAEEDYRRQARYLRQVVIPAREKKVETLEARVVLEDFERRMG